MFTQLVGKLDYPLYVVTAAADGQRAGCLVGFGTQTSIHPPRFLVCISRKNRTYDVACRASALGVHFVFDEPAQRELAELFGGETGDEVDKFELCAWHEGPAAVPLVDDLPNRFTGRILERVDAGDHVGHLLEPVEAAVGAGSDPLSFRQLRHLEPGHAP